MIKPLRGKVLCKIIPKEDRIGSIYVVNTRKDYPVKVKVLAIGEEDTDKKGRRIRSYAHEGGILYIKKNSGSRFKIDGEDLIMVKNQDIIGRI